MPGVSIILRAAPTARSLLEPITKLSRVYFELRPFADVVVVDLGMDFVWRLIRLSFLVISRERTLDLVPLCTSKSIVFTVILLASNADLMIS